MGTPDVADHQLTAVVSPDGGEVVFVRMTEARQALVSAAIEAQQHRQRVSVRLLVPVYVVVPTLIKTSTTYGDGFSGFPGDGDLLLKQLCCRGNQCCGSGR